MPSPEEPYMAREPYAVTWRAIYGSRAIGSRPLIYGRYRYCHILRTGDEKKKEDEREAAALTTTSRHISVSTTTDTLPHASQTTSASGLSLGVVYETRLKDAGQETQTTALMSRGQLVKAVRGFGSCRSSALAGVLVPHLHTVYCSSGQANRKYISRICAKYLNIFPLLISLRSNLSLLNEASVLRLCICTWLSSSRSWKPSSALRYFLSLYFLRMNVARCSTEAPLWTSSSKGRLAAQKLFAFLFPTSRKSWGVEEYRKRTGTGENHVETLFEKASCKHLAEPWRVRLGNKHIFTYVYESFEVQHWLPYQVRT